MLIRARRPMTLSTFSIALVLLFFLSALPAAAFEPMQRESDDTEAVDSPKHPTLDSELALLARDVRGVVGAPRSLAGDAEGSPANTVAVSIRVDAYDGAMESILNVLRDQRTEIANVGQGVIEAYVPFSELSAVGGTPGVASVRRIVPPVSQVLSQGAGLHGALGWNESGYTGEGVKVGIIDVGFIGYSKLIGTELPMPTVHCYRLIGRSDDSLQSCERGEPHGTAVAETLIDVAPDAELFIANPISLLDLYSTVDWMIEQDVDIINHSVVWTWEGPGDGTSPYIDGALAAIQKATDAGILWVNAAGNQGVSTWTGPFVDMDVDGLMEFVPNDQRNGISVTAGKEILLQTRWDDSWANADTDIDVYLVNDVGEVIRSAEGLQAGNYGDAPFEFFSYRPAFSGTISVEVKLHSGDVPSWVQVQELSGWSFEHSTKVGTIGNPAESRSEGMLAVGAVPWSNPSIVEPFSNQGPTLDGRIKPDLVGIDFADTATYGASGFSGTSQSASHVAGLAALVQQRYANYGALELADYLTGSASRATRPDNQWGYGLAQLLSIAASDDNPVPEIVGVNPSSIVASVDPIEVVVAGTGFVSESVVRVNGEDRPTTFVSKTELRLMLITSDTSAGADLEIEVASPLPGGGPSNVFMLRVWSGTTADITAFDRTWERTDAPIADLQVSRTWMWGQSPIAGTFAERYDDAPGAVRTVTYYDKSRMEISDPDADPSWLWYVTNGLLVKELVSGEIQVGETTFETRGSAEVNVAGDPNDPDAPTYASLAPLVNAVPLGEDAPVIQRLSRSGVVTDDPLLTERSVTAAWRVTVEGIDHQVASVFWDFMNSSGLVSENDAYVEDALFENPFYATGYPITEAYWVTVAVDGIEQDVLVQCFERRCLTYTPGNDAGWEVETGNVGQHYFRWRYGVDPTQP